MYDFTTEIQDVERYLVTKSIAEVAELYQDALGFTGYFEEVDDKSTVVANYLNEENFAKLSVA